MYLTLHDTLTRAKRRFEPLDPAEVSGLVATVLGGAAEHRSELTRPTRGRL